MSGPAFDLVTRRLAERTGYQPSREGGAWRCPAHADQNPSLSVSNGDGKVLLNCHGPCDLEAILAALDLKASDLFDEPMQREAASKPTVAATYTYTDEQDRPLFLVKRWQPGFNGQRKSFTQHRPDGTKGIAGVRRVPYRLPAVLDAVRDGRAVFVVEGEKDVHAVEAAGATATCNPAGAAQWRGEFGDYLAGAAQVVIVRDKDAAGMRWAADVEASIAGKVSEYVIVEALTGKDAADHLGAGHTLEELQLVDDLAPADVDTDDAAFFVDWADFWARDRRDADWLYEPVLAAGRGHSIYAGHKVGKSLLMLAVVMALIQLGVIVIYLDYEMGEDDLYDRLADMGYGPDTDLSNLKYALLPSLPPLDTQDGATALLARVDAVRAADPDAHVAVIIDTTGRAVSGEENSADTYRAFYRWTGLGLKQRHVTWARLDHAGKDATKGQRGSSAKGDDVDVVWRLSRTENGLELRRTASRMGWVPEKVTFRQVNDPHLRFVKVADDWPAGTKDVAGILDTLGVPLDSGERPAGVAFRSAGHTATQNVLRAALKWRRELAEDGAA